MRRRVALFAVVVAVAATAPAAAAHHTRSEWNLGTAAALAEDPSILVPADDPSTVNVVGGGEFAAGAEGGGLGGHRFAFGATLGPGGVRGNMTFVVPTNPPFRADVACIVVTPLPDGGGTAVLVGRLDQPFSIFETITFAVTDTGLQGGAGDMFSAFFAPLPPEVQCAAFTGVPGATPISAGNVVVHVP